MPRGKVLANSVFGSRRLLLGALDHFCQLRNLMLHSGSIVGELLGLWQLHNLLCQRLKLDPACNQCLLSPVLGLQCRELCFQLGALAL